MLPVIIVVLVSLTVSAFFSAMEIAFLSSNKLKLELEKKNRKIFSYIADLFSGNPGQYITTMLVGNNMALVVYSIFMSTLIQQLLGVKAVEFLGSGALLIETIISTIVIIFAGEYMPKAIIRLNPNFYYKLFAIPTYFFYIILFPIAKFATWLSFVILRMAGLRITKNYQIRSFERADLANLIEEVGETNKDTENDKDIKLFQNALDFPDITVRDCMVQRVDMDAVEVNTSIGEVAKRFIDTNYSRLPVYKETIDNIIGYVNTKSLFSLPETITDVLKPVEYVTESMAAQKLLTNFIKRNRAVAIVIDEFGGTAGMVTIEDVLEEIFGEIEDEHDMPDNVEKKISEMEFLFSGRLEIEYINEKYKLEIPESEEYDTLAGYIIFNYRGIPVAGETIDIDDKKIKIIRSTSSKLELVRLTVI